MPDLVSCTGLSPSMVSFSKDFHSPFQYKPQSYNPSNALLRHWFGLFPGRSPLLGESFIYFLFLQVLRCFSSLR